MSNAKFIIRVGALASGIAATILGVMIAIGVRLGPELAALGQSLSPAELMGFLDEHVRDVETLIVLDNLFVVAYLGAFIGLAVYVRQRAGWLAAIGLGFGLLTGLLDFLENSITRALVVEYLGGRVTSLGPRIDFTQLFVLNVVGQVKFLCASVAIALFGAGIWNNRLLNRATSVLFLLFVPLNALALANSPVSNARIFGMLALLVLGAVFLWREQSTVTDLPKH